ncbi:MAG: hypothetical protein LBQ77_02850 [Treponema sp.]|nr:hypothetical protein [Treponema sp.]
MFKAQRDRFLWGQTSNQNGRFLTDPRTGRFFRNGQTTEPQISDKRGQTSKKRKKKRGDRLAPYRLY